MTEHIEHLKQSDIDFVIEQCEKHSDDQFRFIPGFEMDCFYIYFIGVGPTKVDFTDDLSIYRSFRPKAQMCVLSHPIKADFRYPGWILEDCDAVEVLNAKHDGKFAARPQSMRLLDGIRKTRPNVVGVVGIDFHHPRQLCPINLRLTRSVPLTADAIMAEIKAGRIQLLNGERSLTEAGAIEHLYFRGRIAVMDAAHLANKTLQGWGIKVPKPVRRMLGRRLEGG
jgi:hypothetical protein